MVSFYIVRHGQTFLNSLDRAQGWTDSPLTNAGKQTAVDLGHKLKGIDFNAVYTSDMLRAVQTAELILEENKNATVPIKKDAFAIKTIFHLFAPEQLVKIGKVKNAAVSRLISDSGEFSLEPDIQL